MRVIFARSPNPFRRLPNPFRRSLNPFRRSPNPFRRSPNPFRLFSLNSSTLNSINLFLQSAMPKAQPQRVCPRSLYLMSPRNAIFAVQRFCIIGYPKSLDYSPDFIFLLYFIYGATECGLMSLDLLWLNSSTKTNYLHIKLVVIDEFVLKTCFAIKSKWRAIAKRLKML